MRHPLALLVAVLCVITVDARAQFQPNTEYTCRFNAALTMTCVLPPPVVPPAPPPVTNSLKLTIPGAPNLPLNGTMVVVTATMAGAQPTKIDLSRDGLPVFAQMTKQPNGTWTFTWCITAGCWGNLAGAHVLNALATYADGTTTTASSALQVADAAPVPGPSVLAARIMPGPEADRAVNVYVDGLSKPVQSVKSNGQPAKFLQYPAPQNHLHVWVPAPGPLVITYADGTTEMVAP